MKKFKFIYCFILLLGFGCAKTVKWEYKTAKTGFKIEVPDYLVDTDAEVTADLKYTNAAGTMAYAFLRDEKDTSFHPEGYMQRTLQSYNDTLVSLFRKNTVHSEKTTNIKIGNLNAVLNEFVLQRNNETAFTTFVLVESDNAFYKLLMSIPEKDRNKYGNDIKRMVGSFREIEN